MKIILLFFILFGCSGTYAQYFNLQFPSGGEPAIFGPGVISDGLPNRDLAISPSSDELFYTLQYGTQFNAILYCKKVNNLWSKPAIAWFSGKYGDLEPAFSPDGKRLYFTSNRPLTDTGKEAKDFDIWYINKTANKWGAPVNMGSVINTAKDEFYASVTKNGNLYIYKRE
jgi:Tol biopolymer transport system component